MQVNNRIDKVFMKGFIFSSIFFIFMTASSASLHAFSAKDPNSDTSDDTLEADVSLPEIDPMGDYKNFLNKSSEELTEVYQETGVSIEKNGLPVYDAVKLQRQLNKDAGAPENSTSTTTNNTTTNNTTTNNTTTNNTTTNNTTTDSTTTNNTTSSQGEIEANESEDLVDPSETVPGAIDQVLSSVEGQFGEKARGHINTVRNIWTSIAPVGRQFFASGTKLLQTFGVLDEKSENILGTIGQLVFGIRSNTEAAKQGSLIIQGFTGISESILKTVTLIRSEFKKDTQTTENTIEQRDE